MLSETMAHTDRQTLRILINRYDHPLSSYSVIAADTLCDLVTLTFDLLTLVSGPMQKSTENVLVSPKYRALYKEIGIKESNDDVRTLTGSS